VCASVTEGVHRGRLRPAPVRRGVRG
jgi:hypothetical protein